jgi:hypothetical protein
VQVYENERSICKFLIRWKWNKIDEDVEAIYDGDLENFMQKTWLIKRLANLSLHLVYTFGVRCSCGSILLFSCGSFAFSSAEVWLRACK